MNVWITKDEHGIRYLHRRNPTNYPHDTGVGFYDVRAGFIVAIVPDSVWDSIGPGECKRVVVPEAFDPDGPIEVGDYVQTPRGTPAIVIVACSEFATCHDHDGDTYRVMRDELAILAKAPKPVPKPEPVPVKCRHCGAAPKVRPGSVRPWAQCPECGQTSPCCDTLAEAVEAWNKQNT